jgi:hypothetical protein
MAKITLEFDLETEREMYEAALNGSLYKEQIAEIGSYCFRPLGPGYPDERLKKLLEYGEVQEAILILSEIYQEIIKDD